MLPDKKQTLLLRFRVTGNLGFLSHRETLTMFQRALVRAEVDLCYSQGFNPRARLSLPLPRSVGVCSEDELLSCLISDNYDSSDVEDIRNAISMELPDGIEVISAEFMAGSVSLRATSAEYEFSLGCVCGESEIKNAVDDLQKALESDGPVFVTRKGVKGKSPREIDVRSYIESIRFEEKKLLVRCNITPGGTVRIDEILQLLKKSGAEFFVAVTRKSVEWEMN